jgi:hypothetical protein
MVQSSQELIQFAILDPDSYNAVEITLSGDEGREAVIGDADADTLPGFDCIPQAVCQLQP